MIRSTSACRIAALLAVAAGGVTATPALAGNGCNGVVNIFVWGCAPWDNNNGSRFPYYRKQVVDRNLPKGTEIKIDNGAAFAKVNGQWKPIDGGAAAVARAGGGVIAPGGANVIAAGGGNVIAPGGLNLRVIEGQ
jgi:hypothetical protein